MSGSAAAVVHGFHTFSSKIHLSGVICNQVGGQAHAQWLTEAIEGGCGVPVLGCVPRIEALEVPERHLGLFTVPERIEAVTQFLAQAAHILENHLDLERLYAIACQAPEISGDFAREPVRAAKPRVRLAVARDEAFCFYYEDNLDELRRCGAEIVPFSPLRDERLPENVDGMYLGGGYPELYARQLSENLLFADKS